MILDIYEMIYSIRIFVVLIKSRCNFVKYEKKIMMHLFIYLKNE